MSQSPATLNTSHPMKKKIIAALVAVAIGHIGVLWAISHIQPIKLKLNDKKPLKVRMLTIGEQQTPPPQPVEKKVPPKPVEKKVEPKPVREKVEPKPVEKDKVIVQKTQKKTEAKVIKQDDNQEKLKQQQELEKQRLDQLKREQELKDQQAREQALRDQQARDQALKDQQAREQAQKDQQAQKTPKQLSQGDAEWSMGKSWVDKQVQNEINSFADKHRKVKGQFSLTLNISVNEKGNISSVTVSRSSGDAQLDQAIRQVISRQRFKPYKVDGVAVTFTVPLPLAVEL